MNITTNKHMKYVALAAVFVLGAATGSAKTFSVLGDSYSTFEGYMVEESAPCFYSASKGAVKRVEDTWWMRFAAISGYTLENNNSYSGSTISNACYTEYPVSSSFVNRCTNLGNNPDIVFVLGGTNDSFASTEANFGTIDALDADKALLYPAVATLKAQTPAGESAVYCITTDAVSTRYYTLQGTEIAADALANGIYIVATNNAPARKLQIRH